MSDKNVPNHAHINAKIAREVQNAVTAIRRSSSTSSSQSFTLIRRLFMKSSDNPSSSSSSSSSSSRNSRYTRYSIDKETFKDAIHAVPSVYKFFLMVFRLSPLRTVIMLVVFMVQGFL